MRWARALEGTVLAGRYALERLIGEGGMGAVFAATQIAVQRRVAVKVLSPAVGEDASVLERFHREAILVARIARRGVPQVIDFDRDAAAGPFMVMDLLEGESLADRLGRRERLDPREAATVAAAVLETLEAVHAAGVVHRDLKPANVFLAREPDGSRSVKVLDFGVARVAAPTGDLTVQGTVLGTPRYMAPEQAAGDPAVDARADLYAVGAVLYACLRGKPPYDGLSGEAVLAAVRERPMQPLGEASPGLPAALVALVERATARSPADRFASAAEMRRALASVLAELPEQGPPSSAPATRGPASAQATVQERTAPLQAPRRAEPTAPLAPGPPEPSGSLEVAPSTRTPPRPAPSSTRPRRRSTRLVVPAAAIAAIAAALAVPAVRTALRGGPAAPGATASAAPEGSLDVERARDLVRSGDATAARGVLDAVLHRAEASAVRAGTPDARPAATALLLIGELDERDVRLPSPREPDAFDSVGLPTFAPVLQSSQRATDDYLRVASWGVPEAIVCAQRRLGRLWERLGTIAGSMEVRDLATLRRRPDAAPFEVADEAGLTAAWRTEVESCRRNARLYYESAAMQARILGGATAVDPLDGADCLADSLARRDALAAVSDDGP